MHAAQSATSRVFTQWLQAYGGIPVKVARSFAADPEDQRDLRQQMHLQIWRSIAGFAAQAKVSTWIYRVCLNTAMTLAALGETSPPFSAINRRRRSLP